VLAAYCVYAIEYTQLNLSLIESQSFDGISIASLHKSRVSLTLSSGSTFTSSASSIHSAFPMLKTGIVLLGLLARFSCAHASTQQPFTSDAHAKNKVLNDDFVVFVKNILANETIPGISVAVVRPDGEVELGAWGNRTEEGTELEPNVTSASSSMLIMIY
jgi:hypothetical protein